jgi:hypothetical protein
VSARELEELLAAHFDGALDDAGAGRLDAALGRDEEALRRLAELARVEGLLRAGAAGGKVEGRLTARVLATLHRAGSRRKFVKEVMQDLPSPRPRRWLPRLMAAAALLLVALAGGWLLVRRGSAGTVASADRAGLAGSSVSYGQKLETAAGENLRLSLADGSTLALLPRTRASVSARRRVSLEAGEIALKCRADRSNPFSVLAHGTEGRAVGTEYTVTVKEKKEMKPTVIVSIVTGLVLVTNDWGSLQAGEGKTVVSAEGRAPALLAEKPAAPKPAPKKAEGALAKSVSAEYVEQPFDEVCKYLSGLGPKVNCDGNLAKTPITLRLSKVPLVAHIRWLARLSKAKAYELPDKSILITTTRPKGGTELLYVADDSEEWKKEVEKKLKKKVNFEFVQAPLTEALNFLQQVSDVNMVVDPAVRKKNPPITLKMAQAPLRLALSWILKLADLEYRLVDHALFITKAGKPAAGGGAEPSAKLTKALGKKVSLEFTEQPLEECINYCRGLTDANVIVDPKAFAAGKVDPKTPVTLRLEKVSLRTALEKITGTAGLSVEFRKGNVVFITLPAGKSPAAEQKPKPKPKPEVF